MSATTTRPALRDHVTPGIRVFNVHAHRVYRIIDLHDEDRTALLVGPAPGRTRYRVTYGDLIRDYRLVQPFAGPTGGAR